MKTTFQLIPFKSEKNLNISGCLERNLKTFTLSLHFLDPEESIKFSYSKNQSYKRAFGLWEKTCFEVFLKKINSNEYIEFNFSPDLEWSCFHFDDYKEGMKNYEGVKIIDLNFDSKTNTFRATWEFDFLNWDFNCGISTIIENKDLKKSFWALKHPNLTPDFHDFRSFALHSPQSP
ncbi:MAG: hypothetical protein ACHQYQ_04100 [Bacteriovoracales bacterium]